MAGDEIAGSDHADYAHSGDSTGAIYKYKRYVWRRVDMDNYK